MAVNIDVKEIRGIVKDVCNFLIIGAVVTAPFIGRKRKTTIITNTKFANEATYSDVIEAVSKSGMLGSTKTEVIKTIKQNGTSEYYKAVIAIINSDMLDSYKRDNIKTISHE